VIGIDFSGGMGSVLTQLNAALGGAGLQFSNPSGSTLRVLDDGAAGLADVNAASVTTTTTSLTSGGPELPLFTDGGYPYSGTITAYRRSRRDLPDASRSTRRCWPIRRV
jgi:flagellar hook-associated protein 1 FlgK